MSANPNSFSLAECLRAWGQAHEISERQLSAICGGPMVISKSTAHRIYAGTQEFRCQERVVKPIMEGLTSYLKQKGLSESEIQSDLSQYFPREVVPNMTTPKTVLPYEVQQFFGLRFDPFSLNHDPRNSSEAFTSPALEKVMRSIEDTVNFQGFKAVIGDIGSGKTILKNRLLELSDGSNGKLHVIWPKFAEMGRVTAGAIVNLVLEVLNQRPKRGLVASQRQLELVLKSLTEQRVRVALGFDECHRLNDVALSALKNLFELGTGGFQKYLGIVLFGQPQFLKTLQDYRFREIAERLEVIPMPDLGKHAMAYVAHRVQMAGGNAEAIFEPEAMKKLAAQGKTPLAIGNLCNQALIQAHALNEKKVLGAFVKKGSDEPAVRAIRRTA